MTEKLLNQLITLNKKIIKQNNKIISQNNKIISKIENINEDNSSNEDFNGFMSVIESLNHNDENFEKVLVENDLDIGEVYFSNDCEIYKLKDDGCEVVIENIVGSNKTTKTKLTSLIANESLKSNKAIMSNTIILGNINDDNSIEKLDNISEVLKSCFENGMENILLPFSATADLLYASQELLTTLNLVFYKTPSEAVEKALNF